MAGCCGSDKRSRKWLWPAVWVVIGVFVVGLWLWEQQPHRHEPHHHAEVGPHGGALVDWGDGVFHLEIVPDREAGTVAVYVLDRWAKKAKPIDSKVLSLTLTSDPETVVLMEPAPTAGDPAGQSSRFTGRHPTLKVEAKLSGTISGHVGGKTYSGDLSQK